jgi:hypothetical protein
MAFNPNPMFQWSRKEGYEVSTLGDRKFSAFYATLPNGRTIEHVYQCDIKGFKSIKEGKGKASRSGLSHDQLWKAYLALWEQWAADHEDDIYELAILASDNGYMLRDTYANTPINQARALSVILNRTFGVD